MKKSNHKKLILAIGNTGRQDDGLGWNFAELVETMPGLDMDLEYRYQLQIEDAELIRHYNEVLVVDAYKGDGKQAFLFEPCTPAISFAYSTHALEIPAVLALCKQLYGKTPITYSLAIVGENWDLGIGLSEKGQNNLKAAFVFFEKKPFTMPIPEPQ
jgi:hydrogenase maturation protease